MSSGSADASKARRFEDTITYSHPEGKDKTLRRRQQQHQPALFSRRLSWTACNYSLFYYRVFDVSPPTQL